MKLKSVTISNYRNIRRSNVTFGLSSTILFGKNGAGKTNLITALCYGPGVILSNYTFNGLKNLGTSLDYRSEHIHSTDAFYSPDIREAHYPIEIAFNGLFDGEVVEWSIVKSTASGNIKQKPYLEFLKKFLQKYNDKKENQFILPVLARFSDSFPHTKMNLGKYAKKMISKRPTPPENFGYYKWDAETGCIDLWVARLADSIDGYNRTLAQKYDIMIRRQKYEDVFQSTEDLNKRDELKKLIERLENEEKSSANESSFSEEVSYFFKLFVVFTDVLDERNPSPNHEFKVKAIRTVRQNYSRRLDLQFEFEDGREILFSQLPQGYKRLFSIILDIGYRSYFLNGANTEAPGVVFIDEIELHLHPQLQQDITERFRKTFPGIQFVFSTHSPIVLSNFNADGVQNKIIRLDYGAGEYFQTEIENVYGRDYTTNLEEVMGTRYRSSTVESLINNYVYLKENNFDDHANYTIKKLIDYFDGNLPEPLEREINERTEGYNQE